LQREARRAKNTLEGKFPVDSWPLISRYALDLLEARQRIAELEKDAERYRFIRAEAAIVRHDFRKKEQYRVSWPTIEAPKQYVYPTYRDRFDAAISFAIAAQKAIAAQRQKEWK
jgi:hypothetical protein